MWNFSWHHEGVKEDALKKGLPVPDEAAVREPVLPKNVETPDLTTVKDFLRFQAATGQGINIEQTTYESLNALTEWFFAGFTRVTDTPTNEEDRSEVYDVSIFCRRHELTLFRTAGVQVELFIANRSYQPSSTPNRYISGNGYGLFRTDTLFPDRMQDIRGVQASLYSCAVPQC